MTRVVCGTVLGLVQVRGDHAAHVAEADMHRDADATLQRAADIITIPGDTLWHVGVDAAREEEAAGVLDLAVIGGDKHDKTNHAIDTHSSVSIEFFHILSCLIFGGQRRIDVRHAHEENHEDAPLLPLIRKPAGADAEKACYKVWWDRQELCSGIFVPEVGNNRREEERV